MSNELLHLSCFSDISGSSIHGGCTDEGYGKRKERCSLSTCYQYKPISKHHRRFYNGYQRHNYNHRYCKCFLYGCSYLDVTLSASVSATLPFYFPLSSACSPFPFYLLSFLFFYFLSFLTLLVLLVHRLPLFFYLSFQDIIFPSRLRFIIGNHFSSFASLSYFLSSFLSPQLPLTQTSLIPTIFISIFSLLSLPLFSFILKF